MAASSDHLSSAILWILLSVVTASGMILAVRGLSAASLGAAEIVFLRAAVVCVAVLVVYLASPAFRGSLRFTKLRIHAVRGALIGVSTMVRAAGLRLALGFWAQSSSCSRALARFTRRCWSRS